MPKVSESLYIDTIIDRAVALCKELPPSAQYSVLSRNIRDLRDRLAFGRLHIAVLGQFNRGKSTFINSLLGMPVLPTSVLPITSVPTVISYGETNECVISFSDNKEDVVARGEAKQIHALLQTYVTEKNNPKNHRCVSEAVVRCTSRLLEHGTVIIDTPGFGSIYTHNTKTTLDLLASCDAALFMLSAELPITQAEVDFLAGVVTTVPRLFFIYNKVDLLGPGDLETSEQFIRDTLHTHFKFTLQIRLFPVSAKTAQNAGNEAEARIKSGLDAVEKEIIDFLMREKYFTLSEALSTKIKEALAQILGTLQKSRDEIEKPVSDLKMRLDAIMQAEKQVQKEMARALSLSEIEESALYEYGDTLLNKNREALRSRIVDRLKKLCHSASGNKNSAVLHAALVQVLEETFSRLFVLFMNECNKPLRNAAAAHIRALAGCAEKIEADLGVIIEAEQALKCTADHIEMDAADAWVPEKSIHLVPSKTTLAEKFYTAEKREKMLFEQYHQQVVAAVDGGLEELLKHVDARITSVFEQFVKEFRGDYIMLLQILKEHRQDAQNCYDAENSRTQPELLKLQDFIRGFSAITGLLV